MPTRELYLELCIIKPYLKVLRTNVKRLSVNGQAQHGAELVHLFYWCRFTAPWKICITRPPHLNLGGEVLPQLAIANIRLDREGRTQTKFMAGEHTYTHSIRTTANVQKIVPRTDKPKISGEINGSLADVKIVREMTSLTIHRLAACDIPTRTCTAVHHSFSRASIPSRPTDRLYAVTEVVGDLSAAVFRNRNEAHMATKQLDSAK
ncbi:hypothetical protein T265_02993 [Opisthorchis viverrini]|uniref:Uncharacterized protein n=1 Tax=Opisthorchis viverrini TaxID=6198 RepID=A0A075AHX5_OPIVI|nr:hypothetical protein T265_02993 [Opisthorchis viverrini]KER30644.1 hypothetical protein T265_02993 [Opisthorchis viverrini]